MSLLDPRTVRYVTKRISLGTLPDAVILDGNHNCMGKITGLSLSGKQTRIFDNHDSLLVESEKKTGSAGSIYFIRDSTQNLLGTVSTKMFTGNRSFLMRNNSGILILIGEGPQVGPFDIRNESGKIIAKVLTNAKNSDELIRVGQNIVLQIIDLSFDRISLLGFFISMYSDFLEQQGSVEQRPESTLEPD